MTEQENRTTVENGGYNLVSQVEDTPPSYEATSSCQPVAVACEEQKPDEKGGKQVPSEKLPSYELATNLPTYDDFQESKEDEARREVIEMFFGNIDKDEVYVDGVAVGTDCMFMFSFILSFFFNWLGFFVGYCILMNLAGRYGALSGLGLSLVNWLFYVKYTTDAVALKEEVLLIWWFFVFVALLLTMKGFVNWFKARKLLDLSPEQRQNGRVVVLY